MVHPPLPLPVSLRRRVCRRILRLSFSALLAFALALAGLFGIPPATVRAATITVTNTNDSGAGSLRAAIATAGSGDSIAFSLTTPATITLLQEIVVDKDLVISGPGVAQLVISGGNSTRIFKVTAGTLRLDNMSLKNGYSKGEDGSLEQPGTYNGAGGAVYVSSGAGLTAEYVTFMNNRAVGGNGADSVSSGTAFYSGGGGGMGGAANASRPVWRRRRRLERGRWRGRRLRRRRRRKR